MSPSPRLALKAGFSLLVLLALSWFVVNVIRNRRPYHVDESVLSGWTLVAGTPGDGVLVGLKPPAGLSTILFAQISQRESEPLTAPAHALVPLVLEDEYSEGLQGVMSVDDILNVAREVGVDSARFEPVCIARRSESASGAARRLFFVVFDSPLFREFRLQLTPLFPEHAGNGTYDATALVPMLQVAGSDREFGRWWPLAFEQQADCRAGLQSN